MTPFPRPAPGLTGIALLLALTGTGAWAQAQASPPTAAVSSPAGSPQSPSASESQRLESRPPGAEGRGQVYVLRPAVKQQRHLFELQKTIDEMGLARRSRVDLFSGSLVVWCQPSELPEVERLVKALTEATGEQHPTASKLKQLAIEVKVVQASAAPADDTTGALDPLVNARLSNLFGYKSFRILGSQFVQVKVGTAASSTQTFLRDPDGKRDHFFQYKLSVDYDQEDLVIRASLHIGERGGELETTFVARPNRPIIIGNAANREGQAFVFIVTPRLE